MRYILFCILSLISSVVYADPYTPITKDMVVPVYKNIFHTIYLTEEKLTPIAKYFTVIEYIGAFTPYTPLPPRPFDVPINPLPKPEPRPAPRPVPYCQPYIYEYYQPYYPCRPYRPILNFFGFW